MTLAEIEELRAKGWYIAFVGDEAGWMCTATGPGLSHGEGGGKTLGESADVAMQMARSMEDDPDVVIKKYGAQVEKMAQEIFGPGVYQGLEAVRWEPGEPVKIAIGILSKVKPQAYVELEVKMIHRMVEELPREVHNALVFEVDYSEESGAKK